MNDRILFADKKMKVFEHWVDQHPPLTVAYVHTLAA